MGVKFSDLKIAVGDEPMPTPEKKAKPSSKLKPLLEEAKRVLDGALLLEAEAVIDDSAYEAREHFFSAINAQRDDAILRRLIKAVRTDPNCADALTSLLGWVLPEAKDEERLPYSQGIEKAAARGLGGDKFFKETSGYFWGVIETRPFMRAKHALGKAYYELGQLVLAAQHLGAMLELNPNDNQGIRYELLPVFLELKELQQASALLKRYADDASAMWAWGRVLQMQLEGKEAVAKKALLEARKANSHAEKYLNGNKKSALYPIFTALEMKMKAWSARTT